MMTIQHPVVLEDEHILLQPLEAAHFDALIAIGQTPEIWTHLAIDGFMPDVLMTELKAALIKRTTGEQYPFTIVDKRTGAIIGSTRLYNIFPEHRKLEIGWTWYSPEYWGTGCNTACKLLLLTYCFETLHTVRVQLQTREQNLRSRAAIEKLGAKLEGILRNDRIRKEGISRNTAIFSIIDSEWLAVKQSLQQQLTDRGF
jgi:N-acetyltransferase